MDQSSQDFSTARQRAIAGGHSGESPNLPIMPGATYDAVVRARERAARDEMNQVRLRLVQEEEEKIALLEAFGSQPNFELMWELIIGWLGRALFSIRRY